MRATGAAIFGVSVAALSPAVASAQVITLSNSGSSAAIQPTVDAFRNAIGPLNANVAGSFGTGRREINWDGVPDAFAAPNNLPANFFNVNSPRGVVLSTPGTGFQVSANAVNPTSSPIEFGNIDPNYPGMFAAFSAQRLFTALGSTITDVNFFIPGTSTAASTNAFGVVFSDVDNAGSTTLQFFDMLGASLGVFIAPAISANESFSFLGVQFTAGQRVGRVRITSGNQVLAAGSTANDLVVMDDFIYGEPGLGAQVVPEPATIVLLAFGLAGVGITARRRKA